MSLNIMTQNLSLYYSELKRTLPGTFEMLNQVAGVMLNLNTMEYQFKMSN